MLQLFRDIKASLFIKGRCKNETLLCLVSFDHNSDLQLPSTQVRSDIGGETKAALFWKFKKKTKNLQTWLLYSSFLLSGLGLTAAWHTSFQLDLSVNSE